MKQDIGMIHGPKWTNVSALRTPVKKQAEQKLRFSAEEPPKPEAGTGKSPSPQDRLKQYFERLGLMQQLKPEQRKQVFEDLRTRHIGFWRTQFENIAHGTTGLVGWTVKLPVEVLKQLTGAVNMVVPVTQRVLDKQQIQGWIDGMSSFNKGVQDSVVSPVRNYSDPAALDSTIERASMVKQLKSALKRYGTGGEISFAQVEALSKRVQEQPQTFDSPESLEEARQLAMAFPGLVMLSDKPETVTEKTLESFVQNVKDSVPFMYEDYGQDPEKYVGANLYYLGAASEMPDLHAMTQYKRNISEKLNQSPAYRGFSRWAKEQQLSDMQFLLPFSFVDALYGQVSAYGTGLSKHPPSLPAIAHQMFALEGVFNGIGFFVTKLQIVMVGWEKERPERERAGLEKALLQLKKQNDTLQKELEAEKEKLAEAVTKNPEKKEQLELEFQKKVLAPLMEKTTQMMQQMAASQLELDKNLGIKPMGFMERMWKKPPKLISDQKYLFPINMVLTLAYEYAYINRYTDYPLDPISWKFAALVSWFSVVGAINTVVMKTIIHMTQDKAKLYLHGKKDEMLAEKTRPVLSGMKINVDTLKEWANPKVKELGAIMDAAYRKLAMPLIGDESQQSGTEKNLNRQAKLQFSIDKTEAIAKKLTEMKPRFDQIPWFGKTQEHQALGLFQRYLQLMSKIHDKAAYVAVNQTKHDLKTLAHYYTEELSKTGLEKHLKPEDNAFFHETMRDSTQVLEDLHSKYPKAELPYEPLQMLVSREKDKLVQFFKDQMEALRFKPEIRVKTWGETIKGFFGFGREQKHGDLAEESLGKRLNGFAADTAQREAQLNEQIRKGRNTIGVQNQLKGIDEEKRALQMALGSVERVQNGLDKGLYIINAPSKEEALKAMDDYYKMREDYAEETTNMGFGLEKMRRMGVQTGMAAKQAWMKAVYLDKYNSWFTGYPYIPSHSLVNIMGRVGMTSIVQGKLLPAMVMLKLWALGHMPLRTWNFLTEKFLIKRDEFHHEHNAVEARMADGMEKYIRDMIAENKPRQAEGQVIPFPQPGEEKDKKTLP